MALYLTSTPDLQTYPTAPDETTAMAWQEQRRRRQMIEGCWERLLYEWLAPMVDKRKLDKWKKLDTSKNLFASLTSKISVLYSRPPVVFRRDHYADALTTLTDAVTDAGLWQLAANNQQLTVGLREGAIAAHTVATGAGHRPVYTVIPADHLAAAADPATPDEPHTIYWYRLRSVGDVVRWTRDAYCIEDPNAPYMRIEDESGEDLTRLFPDIPHYTGDNWPNAWRINGAPFIPIELYHAVRTGKLFDPYRGIELVDGSLTVAGLWSMWQHIVRDCSHPQRWTFNAELEGVEVRDGVASVVTDPATLLSFSTRPGQTGSAGQFSPGGDPEAIARAIQMFGSDLVAGFDLTPGDVKRVHTEARSGYAIEITKDDQREAQKKFTPTFSRSDIALLSKTAAMLGLPTDGWDIRYTGIRATFSERKALIDEYSTRAELGITSAVELLATLDDISEVEARRRIEQFAADRAWIKTLETPEREESHARDPANPANPANPTNPTNPDTGDDPGVEASSQE